MMLDKPFQCGIAYMRGIKFRAFAPGSEGPAAAQRIKAVAGFDKKRADVCAGAPRPHVIFSSLFKTAVWAHSGPFTFSKGKDSAP
jgi:hypothetical protein